MSTFVAPDSLRDVAAVDRPFAIDVLRRAAAMAERFRLVMWYEDGGYFAQGVELPGTGGDGPTPDACMASAREAFTVCLACMIEAGESLPSPITDAEVAAFVAPA